jgi:FkbM family methyltransferase
LAELFFEHSNSIRRYAIGKNDETLRVNQLVSLQGVIDDFEIKETTWHGIPIVRTHDIPKDALIANCSTSISPVAVLRHLRAAGLTHVIGLHELVPASKGQLAWPKFVMTQRNEFREYIDEWKQIYNSLSDNESRQTFMDVMRFRLSCNTDYMKDYTVRVDEQYFEEFMKFNEEIFVDAGGFDGDTTESFAKRYPNYKKIIFFEPSEKNMMAARKRLSSYRDIDYQLIGLSDVAGIMNFNPNAGSASAITDSSDSTISVDTLDSAAPEPVTFIKMDLEGWEMNALTGARHHIARDRPKLAIAVYHDSSDPRRVYRFISEFGHKYRCYLRHYTQGWSETVMFFV